MEQFFNSLPRWAQVAGALVVGLVLILIFNPPHTACDSQFEVFKKSQTPFVYKDPAKKFMTETLFEATYNDCRQRRLPGACYPLFDGVRGLIKDIKTASLECRASIAGKSEVKSILWQSVGFIFELAWGDAPPASSYDRAGWLDNAQMDVFCNLQNILKETFTEAEWTDFREKTLQSLPGAAAMERKEVWNRSLFTIKCGV